jgi:hypothetical protein
MLIGLAGKYLIAGNPGFLTRNPVKCTVWILRLMKALAWDGMEPRAKRLPHFLHAALLGSEFC